MNENKKIDKKMNSTTKLLYEISYQLRRFLYKIYILSFNFET